MLQIHAAPDDDGPGGTGKRALAHLAADVADRYPDRTWFVRSGRFGTRRWSRPPSPARSGSSSPAGGPFEMVAEWAGQRRILFVLDNFEQVIEGAPIVGDLLPGPARTSR